MLGRIEIDPRVCNGKPVIRGTRIPVSVILEQLAAGETWDCLLKGYPELKRDDICEALLRPGVYHLIGCHLLRFKPAG